VDDVGVPIRGEGEAASRLSIALENRQLYQDLRQTADELALANETKDEFLGLISHELKTPITTILGNAEVLERRADALDASSRAGALADIRNEAERLHRIIDNLLVLARLKQGQSLEREPVLIERVAHRRRSAPPRLPRPRRPRAMGRRIVARARLAALP
jgi:K+-sensing histidine kinase KdpD